MSSTDNVLRTKILREINEEFHQGDKLNAALDNSDILEELIKCFVEDDATIRELASRAVIKVAGTEKGRSMLAMPMLNEED
jgi:regulator of RNase E activity RraB